MLDKHIVFFDIDGTLLNEEKELPKSTKEAIAALKKAGHEVAIATGRAPFFFQDLREELEIDTYVCFNGQYVVYKGEVIHRNPLNSELLEDLAKVSLAKENPIVFMGEEEMKANVPDHDAINEGLATLKVDMNLEHDPTYNKGRDIYQSLLFCEESEERFYEEKYSAFNFVRWHPRSVDVVPAEGSKAVGIRKVTDLLDIKPGNHVAFGDSLNDLEMLTEIPKSVAMGNGHPRAKQAAKYETAAVDEDGILKGLQMLGLL
ncbi:Cof-type HAD-IIB family hydrolase [Oceanobacillus picturae]|uniref:Cof-type HAD-IIB family hydrolase n=1 Tax=Oceanobacillus picturae TaxID=171693 RepID=UPI000E682083|nr:Cof-type HAD-IIB family hydrolase [Oceanobacillus picturae]RIU90085.1 Cof-type HAD-IIB family hydrolase [Oceanobacillus picturae]